MNCLWVKFFIQTHDFILFNTLYYILPPSFSRQQQCFIMLNVYTVTLCTLSFFAYLCDVFGYFVCLFCFVFIFDTYFDWSTGCIHARAPSGSSLRDVTGPRGWLRSPPVGGRPNIKPLVPRGPADGYSFRPHSNSRVGQGEAELKPGAASSDLSFIFINSTFNKNLLFALINLFFDICLHNFFIKVLLYYKTT